MAIEDVQKKIAELDAAIHQVPPDPKILQMVKSTTLFTFYRQLFVYNLILAGFTFIAKEMFLLIITFTASILIWTIFPKIFMLSIHAIKSSPVTKRRI